MSLALTLLRSCAFISKISTSAAFLSTLTKLGVLTGMTSSLHNRAASEPGRNKVRFVGFFYISRRIPEIRKRRLKRCESGLADYWYSGAEVHLNPKENVG